MCIHPWFIAIWLCSAQFSADRDELLKAKYQIVKIMEYTIQSEEETIKQGDQLIEPLKLEFLSLKGLLHCRSLLEEINFNVTNICNSFGIGEKQGKFEIILITAVNNVMKKYQGSNLHIHVRGNLNEMYHIIINYQRKFMRGHVMA